MKAIAEQGEQPHRVKGLAKTNRGSGTPNNEIGPAQYVDLVVPNTSAPGFTLRNTFHLVVSSVQNGESFNIVRSNGAPGAGTLVGLLFGNQQHGSPNCVGD